MLWMQHLSVKVIDTRKLRDITLLVIVIPAAIKNELAADRHGFTTAITRAAALGSHQPAFFGRRPVCSHHLVLIADMALHVIFRRCLTNIVEDFLAVGDGRFVAPGLEAVTVGIHITVGANPRIAE